MPPGDEPVEPRSGKIVDDLARGRRLVNGGVGLGLELARQEPALCLGQFYGLLVHAEAFLSARRQDDLRTHHPHQLAPFDGKAVGHGHDQRVTFRRADHCQTDAGIARRRLDYRLAWAQASVAFGLLNDVERQPVLDRPGRIEGFGLDVEFDTDRGEVVDPNCGSVTHSF